MIDNAAGKALTQARIARGLSLLDVERDTRISNRYLRALEEGRLDILPAPVYARAFMRTYAQYLGLDANALVQQIPGSRPEPTLPPLPEVSSTRMAPIASASWLVAGGVVVILLIVGLVIFWNSGGDSAGEGTSVTNPPTSDVAEEQPTTVGAGAEQPVPPTDVPTEPAPTVEPGVVPALEEQDVLSALSALSAAGLPFLVIEVEIDDVETGTVYRQSPSPGTAAGEETVVTLLVSR